MEMTENKVFEKAQKYAKTFPFAVSPKSLLTTLSAYKFLKNEKLIRYSEDGDLLRIFGTIANALDELEELKNKLKDTQALLHYFRYEALEDLQNYLKEK